ncbi:hypothetical protein EVAR_5122_1 [Eumeta japonica]|uniref:Mariner Mos1 transposase n=1 Tax=Eumeta variegata TaxID=151549 RepID=A0A4C1SXT3_EUMVA|nr:hypothetical protein EVAR_5122_1 [Eumeta japonica]
MIEDQKLRRLKTCRKMVGRFADKYRQFKGYGIITGDDGWMYCSPRARTMWYLFPKIKEKLRGKRFTDVEEEVVASEKAAETTPECEWVKCFSQWSID